MKNKFKNRQNLGMDLGDVFYAALTLGGVIKNIDKSESLVRS